MPSLIKSWVKNVNKASKGAGKRSGVSSTERHSNDYYIQSHVHKDLVILQTFHTLLKSLYTPIFNNYNLLNKVYAHNPHSLLLTPQKKSKER